MLSKRKFHQFAAIAALSMSITMANAQKIILNLNKDQKFKVETTVDSKSVMSAMGQEIENLGESKNITTVKIINAESKSFTLSQTLTKAMAKVTAMGQEMSYDSDKKNNEGPIADEMQKQFNKEYLIIIDGLGNVTKKPENSESSTLSPTSMLSGNNSTDIAIINQSFLNNDIKIGNSWTDSTLNEGENMKTKVVTNCKVISIENEIATISIEGSNTTSGVMEIMEQQMNITTDSKITGAIKVNIKTGILIESNSTSTGTSALEVNGMTIPGTVEIKRTMKVIPE